MDVVLGLSMTSGAVRWVLVEGPTGEGATVDRGSFDLTVPVDPDDLLDVLLISEIDPEGLHAIGVTWTNEAEDAASGILRSLTARGFTNVIAVSEVESADVLAAGIAGIADYDDVAVCIVEPDAALVAVVNANGVAVDRIARPLDGADVVELPSSVLAMLELDDWRPDAVFVVGSADDLDVIVSTLGDVTEAPVFTAADADIALARGAALASAAAVTALQPTGGRHLPSRVGALTSVLAAAVVTFVVSLSAAVGMQLSPDGTSEQLADTIERPAAVAEAPAPPKSPRAAIEQARPVVAQTIVVAAPPPPQILPAYEPPQHVPPAAPAPAYTPPAPAYTPPAPAYAPPPAPAYVPPPQVPNYVPPVQPQPRLRDRIIERIPIINRFHEPQYQYPQP
jgi:hypothetical protein